MVDEGLHFDPSSRHQPDCLIERVSVAHRSTKINFLHHELVDRDGNVRCADGSDLHDRAPGPY